MKYRVVVLQHGSHGTHRDLCCLARHLRTLDASTILWEPRANEGLGTDSGVVVCGERFAKEVLSMLGALCPPRSPSSSLAAGDGDCRTTVQLSFVAHSMGGLIVREALPQLFREIQRSEKEMRVEWKVFCSVATPHGGVRNMDARVRSYLGRFIGRVYSTAYHDMFLQSNILTERLLSAEHLSCLAAFERRVLISSINDLLVPLVSSGFMLRPSQRRGTDLAAQRAEGAAMCALSEEEMCTKQRRIAELCDDEWPRDVCPVERRVAEAMLRGAGPFDSIVVDFRPLVEHNGDPRARHAALKLSHQAIVCKEPIAAMGMDHLFDFASRQVARVIAACHS